MPPRWLLLRSLWGRCLECHHNYASAKRLRSHVRDKHGLAIREARAKGIVR